jgi:hypothetical protein
MTLEEELGGLLRAVGLRSRQRRAVARRLGWDGGAPATLAAAAETEGYTRERVRQLEERVEKAVTALRPSLPLTRAAVDVVGEVAPASRDEVANVLAERGLSERPFDPEGILAAARLSGLAVDVVARPRSVLGRSDVVLEPVVAQVARSLAARDGASTVDAVASTMGMSRRRVCRLLELGEEVTWLRCGAGWFTVLPVGGPLRKLARAFPNADGAGIHRALGIDLPVEVIACLLAAVEPAELSGAEELLLDALRLEGGVAPVSRALQHAERGGVRGRTAAVCLSRSPLFRQAGRGRWALAV